jgi:hypothetical protein
MDSSHAPSTLSRWTTADEQAFLDGLGTHAAHTDDSPSLLQRYRAAMARRVTWGAVEETVIRAYVDVLLAQEACHVR